MVKVAVSSDISVVARLAFELWPSHKLDQLEDEMKSLILDKNAIILLAFYNNEPVGFAQCCLRFDYVEGTSSKPVAYLEGIYVSEGYRKNGIAKELLCRCEEWAKAKGCRELASDCELMNNVSLRFHLQAGFTEANRIICFRKDIL